MPLKDITLCGDAAKFEVSVLREHWMKFTNILLERTVMNNGLQSRLRSEQR